MRDATSKTKFILDSIECIWIVGDYFGAQYLDRNRFAERSVDGAIHHSHAAVADESFDAIIRRDMEDERAKQAAAGSQ